MPASRTDIRRFIPQWARERLYEWHPGRAARWRRYPGIERIPRGGRVALTFDDGPDPEATISVLDALSAAGAPATFFFLGSQVEAHGDVGREVLRRGHEVGLHGFGHERHDRIDSARSIDDIRRGHAAVEDLTGAPCRWYRPPYGKMSDAANEACRSLGLTIVYWSAWGLDWEPIGSERIADVASAQLDDGGILLLHDSAKFARRESALATANALPIILDRLSKAGRVVVPLGPAILGDRAAGDLPLAPTD